MIELKYNKKKSRLELENKINNIRKIKGEISSSNDKGFFVYGDNFEGMSRILDEYKNRIDLVYIDIPFNTNLKFFAGNNRVSTISSSYNDVLAYNDSMEFEEYIEFIRERIYLIHKLLSDKGTMYLHIDTKVGHYLKIIIDEIFGKNNFLNDITRVKSNPKNFNRKAYGNEKDMILVYAKNAKNNIFNNIRVVLSDEEIEKTFKKIDKNGRYTTVPCHAPGETKNGETGMSWKGILPPKGRHWRCSLAELTRLDDEGMIEWSNTGNPRIKKYAKDHKGKKIQDIWRNYKDPQYPIYPTEKNMNMLEMIVLQSSNENSIIMDCFAGSSNFLKVGILNNRYVIGMDNSEISYNTLIKRKELNEIEIIKIESKILLKKELKSKIE